MTLADNPYRLSVRPVQGRVQVWVDGEMVADTSSARLMYETYLAPQLYVPTEDLRTDLLRPSPYRTFCPFKGTASHWHLSLQGGTVENGAWSYEDPLSEAEEIGSLVAFSANADAEIRFEEAPPTSENELIGGSRLINWLMQQAWFCPTPAELTRQFAPPASGRGNSRLAPHGHSQDASSGTGRPAVCLVF